MKFEDITDEFYQSIVVCCNNDYIGYCIPIKIEQDFENNYRVYGHWKLTWKDAITEYENVQNNILRNNYLKDCKIFYHICPRCKNESKYIDDITMKLNPYEYNVNNVAVDECMEIMCEDCQRNLFNKYVKK